MLRYPELTQDVLQNALHYDPETGAWTWLESRGSASLGSPAGSINGTGYRYIHIGKKDYKSSRLAWLYVYGKWPDGIIDHINNIRHDDRLCNLRESNAQSNAWNRLTSSNNKSGYKGVSFCKSSNKWRACINQNGKNVSLGRYSTPEEAAQAYKAASIELHGQYSKL